MKKILVGLIAIVMSLGIIGTSSASLYNYYTAQGVKMPSLEARAVLYKSIGNDVYQGTASQNKALEAYLSSGFESRLGGTPTPSTSASMKYVETGDFTLFDSAVAGDTSITLDSLKDIYNNTLTMSDFGDKGFGRINPEGDNVSEAFSFSGITANSDGTYTLTGVKTVLAKYP
jgi:hypothetical protein